MATPPPPKLSLFVIVVAREIEGVEFSELRMEGECRLSWDMLPGIPAVEGIRLRRGRSVGGRGAGPGFMN